MLMHHHGCYMTVESGLLLAVVQEKPMAHSLEEVDVMVSSCAQANVPLNCGAITTTDPSFGKAKELIQSGAIGELISIEANSPAAQHQGWSYFLDSQIDFCVGFGHQEVEQALTERGGTVDNTFNGQGVVVAKDGTSVFFRTGSVGGQGLKITGSTGELEFDYQRGWCALQSSQPLALLSLLLVCFAEHMHFDLL